MPKALLAQDVSTNSHLGTVCFAVADERTVGSGEDQQDTLTQLNTTTADNAIIGATGTTGIEAISFGPSHQLYGADGSQLGILDLATGAFTALPQTLGTGGGSLGEISLNDVDGLAYSLDRGIFFGIHRRKGADLDLLFAINPATGAHIPDYFGPDNGPKTDYVPVPAILDEQNNPLADVDDIQFNPVTGILYGAMNTDGGGGVLVTINVATGVATPVATFRYAQTDEVIDDIEGISFSNGGILYASTGDNFDFDADDLNRLFQINPVDGTGTLIGAFPTGPKDYEGLACLSEEAAIVLKKYTNGPGQLPDDADTPTGPMIEVGAPVTWTFTFTNTGVLTLTDLSLVDDHLGNIGLLPNSTCLPAGTELGPGQSLTCTATGVATAGQYSNIGTISGRTTGTIFPTATVTDTDPSHYFGVAHEMTIQATPLCIKDAPYIRYTVTPNFPVGANPVNIRFLDATTNEVIDGAVYTGQPLTQDLLWHGAAIDPVTKVGVQWPGWKLENGIWVEIPTQLRPTVKVEFAVNPTEVVTLAYPPSSPTCSTAPRASLGDRVWFDLDKDGQQEDGENGVQGVKVTLFGDDNIQVGSPIFTNVQGEYLFTGLYPDTYYVVFDPTSLPPGFTFTIQNASGSGEDVDSDANASGTTASVTLSAGQAYLDLDAGIVSLTEVAKAALGDTVWLDLNKNGLQDFNEAGVPNVEVRLFGAGGTPVATQFTNANGKYLFDNLLPGSYYVEFVGPTGYNFTHYNVSGNTQDASDSDAIAPWIDISISDGGVEAELGKPLAMTVFYTNTDPTLAATNVVITTTIPEGTTFIPGSSDANWSCTSNNAGGVCTLTMGTIAPNAKGSLAFTILLGKSEDTSPDVLDLIFRLSTDALARTADVVLSAGETDLTVDAGLVIAQASTFAVTPSGPTSLPEGEQPGQIDNLFLPTVGK